MLTAETLTRCLELVPRIREFLGQQHLDGDMDARVLRRLLCFSPRLEVLDLCASSSSIFLNGIVSVVRDDNPDLPSFLPIRRLGLHECSNLPTQVFRILLPRLVHLNRLDVAHTTIDSAALASIPHTARLTHLNVGRCPRLSGSDVVKFLINHPAAQSLEYLNISAASSQYSGISAEGLEMLLPRLPGTLKSLNLSGNAVQRIHVPHLRRLSKHLIELGVGHTRLSMADLNNLFAPAKVDSDDDVGEAVVSWTPTALRFIDVSCLPGLTSAVLCNPHSSLMATPSNTSLEVIEVDDNVSKGLKRRQTGGWTSHEIGRRNFLVRSGAGLTPSEKREMAEQKARRWGSRKTAMSKAKVGGIYAHYSSGVK